MDGFGMMTQNDHVHLTPHSEAKKPTKIYDIIAAHWQGR
jgi:hypothetical protein